MPFDVAVLSDLEDALSECLKYHNDLDRFLLRSGVTQNDLDEARNRAELKSRTFERRFQRAPKRYVVQELLDIYSNSGENGDRVVSSLITSVVQSSFKDPSQVGKVAVENLKKRQERIFKEREQRQREKKFKEDEEERNMQRLAEEKFISDLNNRDKLLSRFQNIMSEGNAQNRGYQLEVFLNDLFTAEGLSPKSSFRIVGEQIDGSFSWHGQTHLVEAKWTKSPVAGAEFGAFLYKIEGKTADTRGLFVSINGYSSEALQSLRAKGALKFICIDGAHLFRSLQVGQNLNDILTTLWRHAGETGEAYLSVSQFKDLKF